MLSESLTKTKLTDPLILDLLQNIREHRSMLEDLKSIKIDPNILNEQKKIENNLGLSVLIQNKKNNSGKITIQYKNLEQFEFVSNLLKRN